MDLALPTGATCCCSRLTTEPLLPLRLFLWKAAISSVLIFRIFCCCSCFSSSSWQGKLSGQGYLQYQHLPRACQGHPEPTEVLVHSRQCHLPSLWTSKQTT